MATPLTILVTRGVTLASETWVVNRVDALTMRDAFNPSMRHAPTTAALFEFHLEGTPEKSWRAVGKLCSATEVETHSLMSWQDPKIAPTILAHAVVDDRKATQFFPKRASGKQPGRVLFMEYMPYSLQNDLTQVLATPDGVFTLFDDLFTALTFMSQNVPRGLHNDPFPRNVLAYKDEKDQFRFVLADYGKLSKKRGTEESVYDWISKFTGALARYILKWRDVKDLPALTWLPSETHKEKKLNEKTVVAILDAMHYSDSESDEGNDDDDDDDDDNDDDRSTGKETDETETEEAKAAAVAVTKSKDLKCSACLGNATGGCRLCFRLYCSSDCLETHHIDSCSK